MSIVLSGNKLTFSQLYAVALNHETVSLSPDAIARMKASRAVVDQLVASGKTSCRSILCAPTPVELGSRLAKPRHAR